MVLGVKSPLGPNFNMDHSSLLVFSSVQFSYYPRLEAANLRATWPSELAARVGAVRRRVRVGVQCARRRVHATATDPRCRTCMDVDARGKIGDSGGG